MNSAFAINVFISQNVYTLFFRCIYLCAAQKKAAKLPEGLNMQTYPLIFYHRQSSSCRLFYVQESFCRKNCVFFFWVELLLKDLVKTGAFNRLGASVISAGFFPVLKIASKKKSIGICNNKEAKL